MYSSFVLSDQASNQETATENNSPNRRGKTSMNAERPIRIYMNSRINNVLESNMGFARQNVSRPTR